jgi:hypothetical protein
VIGITLTCFLAGHDTYQNNVIFQCIIILEGPVSTFSTFSTSFLGMFSMTFSMVFPISAST